MLQGFPVFQEQDYTVDDTGLSGALQPPPEPAAMARTASIGSMARVTSGEDPVSTEALAALWLGD